MSVVKKRNSWSRSSWTSCIDDHDWSGQEWDSGRSCLPLTFRDLLHLQRAYLLYSDSGFIWFKSLSCIVSTVSLYLPDFGFVLAPLNYVHFPFGREGTPEASSATTCLRGGGVAVAVEAAAGETTGRRDWVVAFGTARSASIDPKSKAWSLELCKFTFWG